MFTRDEMNEIQEVTTEALSYMLRPFTILRIDREASEIDDFYDEIKYAKYERIPFKGVVNENPHNKLLTKYGLREGNSLQIEVPQEYLIAEKKYISVNDKLVYKDTIYVIKRLFANAEFPVAGDLCGEYSGTDYLTVVILAEKEKIETGEGTYGYYGYREDRGLE